jgi:tRNA1(Val) A37 N6-methylase TrmN6
MDTEIETKGYRHRDVYRSFYTSDNQLVLYMVRLLDPKDGDSCLEPSAGNGYFIDGLLATGKKINVHAIDLSENAVASLKTKYEKCKNIEVRHQDFLLACDGLFDDGLRFDRVIANPPYGGWQEYEKRNSLKSIFPDLYVKETYGLFVAQSLNKLAPNGRAVFILPETFLYLHLQKGLRKRILERYTINSIDIFPSDVFPGVNFGYAKLCIISIDNTRPTHDHSIKIRQCKNLEELISDSGRENEAGQYSVLHRQEFTFPLNGHSPDTRLIDEARLRLGEIADCVTGIYTGDDGRFLRRSRDNTRGTKKYREMDIQKVVTKTSFHPTMEGIRGEKCFLPILKGGGVPYLKPVLWFIDWSSDAVHHYKTDKKARFQNSAYYFKRGIGFPMVSSGRATASVILDSWIFDQSVVGVFPKNAEQFGFLMAFLNSRISWRLLRQINPSTNNSAKYLRRLPIILPSSDRLAWFNEIVSNYLIQLESTSQRNSEIENILDEAISYLYQEVLQENQTIAAQQGAPADVPVGASRRQSRG